MDERSPLLAHSPPAKTHTQASTVSSAIFNLLITTIGASAMALPYTLVTAGYIFGLFGLIISSFLTWLAIMVLGYFALVGHGSELYDDLALKLLGKPGFVVTQLSMILLLIGALAMFLIISLDLIYPFVSPLMSKSATHGVVTIVMAICSVPSSLHALRHLSILAMGCLLYILFAVAIHVFVGGPVLPPAASPINTANGVLPFVSVSGFALALPLQGLAFGCHANVPRAAYQLAHEKRSQVPFIMNVTILGALAFYIILSLTHFYIFRDSCSDNLLADYPTHNGAMNAARIMLSLCLILKAPLCCQPLRGVTLNLGGEAWINMVEHRTMPRALYTFMLYTLVYWCTVFVPELARCMDLVGSTCGVVISYIIPGWMLWVGPRALMDKALLGRKFSVTISTTAAYNITHPPLETKLQDGEGKRLSDDSSSSSVAMNNNSSSISQPESESEEEDKKLFADELAGLTTAGDGWIFPAVGSGCNVESLRSATPPLRLPFWMKGRWAKVVAVFLIGSGAAMGIVCLISMPQKLK